jgi:hypothetical protein
MPMTASPLDQLAEIADVLDRASMTLRERGPLPGPQPGDKAQHLSALLQLRAKFHAPAPNHTTDPAGAAGRRAAEHLALIAEDVGHGVRVVVAEIDQAVATALDRGVRDASVVRTADFQTLHWQTVSQTDGTTAIFALGVRDSLDADHPLRAMPEGDYYRDSSGAKVVVLGRASGDPHALPWQAPRPRPRYGVEPALALTRAWASQQRAADEERQAQERMRQAEAERLWRKSPAGQHATVRDQLATVQRQLAEMAAHQAEQDAREEAERQVREAPARSRRRAAKGTPSSSEES